MLTDKEPAREWRNGVYLTTVKNSLMADIIESKLRGEGIPCLKNYRAASNAMEIIMGTNVGFPIDIYVPEETLEDAQNIIIAVPILSEDELGEDFGISDEELERQALGAAPPEDF